MTVGTRQLYVYAIVEEAPGGLGEGLGGAPLRAVDAGGLAAIVSEHDRLPQAGESELWAHEDVVERLMERTTVLPLRFGTAVVDEDSLGEMLRSRGEEFAELLAAVRGAVELSVRAELSAPAPAPERRDPGSRPTGTEYLRERGRSLRSQEQAREQLHRPLTEVARRAVLFDSGPRGERFRGAYLVDAERVDAFAARVDRLAGELAVEVSCTGPWPPYSFVAGAGR